MLPPLPPGASLLPEPGARPDPYELLKREGFTFTNGYRAEGDVERIRAQGYNPAPNSAHNVGDGVDLDHPSLSPADQMARLNELFGDWDGYFAQDEGHHRHLQLPGWGQAPGTPNTPHSGMPALPEGAVLLQRGSIAGEDLDPAQPEATPDQPAPMVPGGGVVLFKDEQPETTTQRMTPEDEQVLLNMLRTGASAADVRAFAASKGFGGPDNFDEIVRLRDEGATLTDGVQYRLPEAPRPDDGATGAFARGVADPFNLLDETGALFDALGGTDGRENVWNSERSLKDILYGNIDLNRGILEADTEDHPYARLSGQLTSGLILPIGNKARTASQLAKWGAAEGGLAGFGAGEGNPLERLDDTAVGATLGAGAGFTLGKAIEKIGVPAYRAIRARMAGRPEAEVEAAVVRAADEAPTVNETGIAAENLPPLPPGATLLDEGPDPAALQRAEELAQDVNPEDVTPVPANTVGSLEEFNEATGGVQRQMEAPDPYKELRSRQIPVKGKPGKFWTHKGPIDAEAFLRRAGGLRDPDGELAHMGITNAPRSHNRGEHRLGRLIDNENGMDLDDAGLRLWEAGYFPDHYERPDVNDVLELLRQSRNGNRTFHPSDYDEVDRFEAADATAQMVKAAEQEGAPLYEDIGETINLDDLAELQPPASAYEDFPRITGKIGNINLARLEKPEDVSRLLSQIRSKVGGFDDARRGVIVHEETQRLAKELGMKPKDVLKRARGQALNAEELYALRAIAQKSRQVVGNLARKAVGGSDEDVAKFRNAWARHVMIEEQVAGATAEAGRALQQFRMLAKAGDARSDAVKAYLEVAGGRDTVEDAAKKIVDLMDADPTAASKFMRKAIGVRKRDMFNELFVNSLLSGPRTHIVNIVSNAFTAAYQIPEQAATAAVGAILRTPDRVTMQEVGARAVGLIQGSVEGWRLMKEAWKTGMPIDGISKLDQHKYQAIPGKLGQAIRIPTRALTAADEFWKSVNRRAATNAGAYRRAFSGPGTHEEKLARYQELVNDPDKALREYADSQARYYTFQTPLGKGGRAISTFSNEVPGAKLVLPFVRTPINLLKFAGERSPFAPLLREFREAVAAGGNARNEAMARMVMGSGLSGLAVTLALEGKITGGGPSDPKEMQALRNSGWQPYSVRVGDDWVSYQRFEPFSMLLGAAADFTEVAKAGQATPKELDELALGLAISTAKNITSKTWLSGPSDAFEVLSDPERYGKNYVERLVGSITVPSIVAHAAGASDPYLREVDGLLQSIKSRVPGLSDNLEARRNVWGDEIERGSGAGTGVAGGVYNFISPVYTSKEKDSPLLQEVARLKARLSMPQRSLRIDGKTVKLSQEQYSYYVQLAGKPAKAELEAMVQTPEWQALTDDERREYMAETLERTREEARETLKQMFPELTPNPEEDGPSLSPGAPAPMLPPPPLPEGAVLIP